MLLGTLGASNTIRHYYDKWGFLMPPHPLKNLETQKYCQNEPKFNGIIQKVIYLK